MDNLLKKNLQHSTEILSTPVIFNLSHVSDNHELSELFHNKKILSVVDDYLEQLKELFAVQNPHLVYTPNFGDALKNYIDSLEKKADLAMHGRWVYFPWNGSLVHVLEDTHFQTVRTARNRYLIDEKEQYKFYNATIGIGGLSVGNSVALAIVLQGGGKHLKLADFDNLALSNLNRVRASISSLGLNKAQMTARQIYEINPYSKIEIFNEGLTEKNLNGFFKGLDIIVDELDNIAIKFLVRQYAKKYRLPLVMGADAGDNAIVDIERFDLKPKLPFFQGRLGKTSFDQLKNLDKFGIGKTITTHLGPENLSERNQDSLLAMGKTIVSWPQLGGAALLNGSAVAYCVRKILNKQPLENNRAIVSLEEKFIPKYNSPASKKQRKNVANKFKKIFGIK